MILGHNTWTNYALAKLGENIIDYEAPTSGHLLLYQLYVGGIWSGRDWLMSGAGLVVAETTNPGMSSWYDVNGIPVFVRSHQATQYADNIERRTLCGHGELGGGTSGAVDGKVTSASLAKEMKFWARFGHPCGTPISSTEYFAQYPDKNTWLKPWNFSLPTQAWTVLGPRARPRR